MYIAAETAIYRPLEYPDDLPGLEGMPVREEGWESWSVMPFNVIKEFEYERGYEYELMVEKTTLANPPQDASNVEYTLIEIISKQKVVPQSLYRVKIQYAADAEQKEIIERDLENNPPLPKNGCYILGDNVWTIINAKYEKIASGTFKQGETISDKQKMPSFNILMPDEPISAYFKWSFFNKKGEAEHFYDAFTPEMPNTQIVDRLWLCEDLTQHYRAKYPQAGVKEVIRIQKLYWKGIGYEE